MNTHDDLLASERAMQHICAVINNGKPERVQLQAVREVVDRWVFAPSGLIAELGESSDSPVVAEVVDP
jgi:hypothetical protein